MVRAIHAVGNNKRLVRAKHLQNIAKGIIICFCLDYSLVFQRTESNRVI